jgi:hypothetical protein
VLASATHNVSAAAVPPAAALLVRVVELRAARAARARVARSGTGK